MLYVDLPTMSDIKALRATRADACVSIYVETTPLTQDIEASRIAYGNLVRAAMAQLEAAGLDKRRIWPLAEQLDDLGEDDGFWTVQARSLAVLATPDSLRAFRLANSLKATAQVSDRFHLKPLLRALAFPQTGFVLAVTEQSVRLFEVFADLPPVELRAPALPRDASAVIGQASLNDRSPKGRITGSEGKKVRLRQYARAVDAGVRETLAGQTAPLILAAQEPFAAIYRSVNAHPGLLPDGIGGETERLSVAEIDAAARAVLDRANAAALAAARALFETRRDQSRAVTDIAMAARAATMGAIDTLMVDIDTVVPGTVDDMTGAVTFAEAESAASYGVVDEIAGRAIETGARLLAVRAADIPGGGPLAAILRYPV
jgi:hypothetical protein